MSRTIGGKQKIEREQTSEIWWDNQNILTILDWGNVILIELNDSHAAWLAGEIRSRRRQQEAEFILYCYAWHALILINRRSHITRWRVPRKFHGIKITTQKPRYSVAMHSSRTWFRSAISTQICSHLRLLKFSRKFLMFMFISANCRLSKSTICECVIRSQIWKSGVNLFCRTSTTWLNESIFSHVTLMVFAYMWCGAQVQGEISGLAAQCRLAPAVNENIV
jgi:hypothetical protein